MCVCWIECTATEYTLTSCRSGKESAEGTHAVDPPNAINFWSQLAGLADFDCEGVGVCNRDPAGGCGLDLDNVMHASSNFDMALMISASVMISGGTNRTTFGPAGTTNIPVPRSVFAT